MFPQCSSVKNPLATPPGIDASGRYVVLVDQHGETRMLAVPANRSILACDGSNFFWVDGTDALPWIMNQLKLVGEGSTLNGLISTNAGGRIYRFVNETNGVMVLKSQGGTVFWATSGGDGDLTLPQTGSGVLIRPVNTAPVWLSSAGVIVVNANGEAISVTGSSSEVLTWGVNGPEFRPLPSGNISSGNSGASLSGVVAGSTSASAINVRVPAFGLTNGADEITVTNVNVNASLVASLGAGGLDVGAEAASKWYYAYITSDAVDVHLMISENPVSPSLDNTTDTYWGLVSLFRNGVDSNIVQYLQRGRRFQIPQVVFSQNFSVTTSLNPIASATPLATLIPPNVMTVSGIIGGSGNATAPRNMAVAATNTGIGLQIIPSENNPTGSDGFKFDGGPITDLIIADASAPVIYAKANANDNKRRISINGYTI